MDQPGDALMLQFLRSMVERGSDRARPHMLCTARACSPLAMPLGSACGRARARWKGGRSDFLRPIGTSKRVPRRALTYLKRDRWLYRHERRPIFMQQKCTIFHAFRKTTAVISEFRGKSQFRLASAAEGLTEKRVTFIAMVWDLELFYETDFHTTKMAVNCLIFRMVVRFSGA